MKEIKFSDFEIIPVMKSIKNIEMSDETYFSNKYRQYVSNSKLKFINPKEGGSPEIYQNPPRFTTQSLMIGSAVHEVLLQPEEFELGEKLGRPTAKLGAVIDEIYELRHKGLSIYQAIHTACTKISYYVNTIDNKIPFIIKSGLKYYLKLSKYKKKKYEKEQIYLSDRDYDTVDSCLNACYNNHQIMSHLHPIDLFGDEVESHCEDALFIDFLITYKGKCTKIPFKLKIDNWTIDFENKILTLNDLKTTSSPITKFMTREGSMYHYHYFRQMAVYGEILWWYCTKKFGVCKEQGWKFNANMLVVQTSQPHAAECFSVSKELLKRGHTEYEQLLKRIAYYSLFGYDSEVNFV